MHKESMKLYRWLLPAAFAAVLALSAGCKKEESTEYKSLTGSLSVSMPEYVKAGFTKTFMIDTLMTLSCPDGDPLGYYFTNPDTGKRDTLVTADGKIREHYYTVTVADKMATQTVALTAFLPEGSSYSGRSASAQFTIVRSGWDERGSITHFNPSSSGSEADPRDGRKYYYNRVGDLVWMRQNLAWAGSGRAFENCDAMSDIFGRYYTWQEAQTACPDGWRLPTDAEWAALQDGAEPGKNIDGLAGRLMGDLYFNGSKMWEYWRDVKISDELGFSVMPVGYAMSEGDIFVFDGVYAYAAFWTSDEADGLGVCRYIYQDKDIVYRGRLSKTDFGASVRCVKPID